MRWTTDIYYINDIISCRAIVNERGEYIMPIEMFDSGFIDRLIKCHNDSVGRAMQCGANIVQETIKELKREE